MLRLTFWFSFCLLEFIIILILLKKLGNSSPKNINNEKLKKFRNSKVNMDDLMMSINDSKKVAKLECEEENIPEGTTCELD